MVPGATAGSGTIVPGGTVVGQTWTAAGSPYIVTGDITVGGLVIEPAVEVLVDGPFSIEVATTINAVGTDVEPVVFAAADAAQPWRGLSFQNTLSGSELTHCVIRDSDDHGIELINSSPLLSHCLITNNSSPSTGAGINADLATGDLVMQHCQVVDNHSPSHGAGINAIMGAGALRLTGCVVNDNTVNPSPSIASRVGGGIRVDGNLEMVNCQVAGNTVQSRGNNGATYSRGGGLYVANGTASLRNSTFLSNVSDCDFFWSGVSGSANAFGGGVYISSADTSIVNCIFGCNATYASGGTSGNTPRGSGVYVSGGTVSVENVTLNGNTHHGLYAASGSVDVINSLLYWNSNDGAQFGGTVASVTYSNVHGGWPGVGNLDNNPFVVDSSGCSIGDFAVLPGSPCIDAGSPLGAYEDGCFGPAQGGPRNDIGAHGGPGTCQWDIDVAVWLNLGNGLAGSHGTPSLVGEGQLLGGDDVVLSLSNAKESSPAFLVLGFSALNAPFKAGVLVPNVDILFDGFSTDTAGKLDVGLTFPLGFPGGLTSFLQYWIVDEGSPFGFSASNALSLTTP